MSAPIPAVGPSSVLKPNIGDLLHLLITLGDREFVEQIGLMAEARVCWILERDARNLDAWRQS